MPAYGRGVLNSNIILITNLRALVLTYWGFFIVERRKMSNINYEKLNDKIVEQSYRYSGLTADQVAALYEAKVERARALLEARTAVYRKVDK